MKVDIYHQNLADLMATLITPSGRRYKVFEKRELVGRDQELEFLIRLEEAESKGSWTLEVRDLIPRNKGVLKSWSFNFASNVCG